MEASFAEQLTLAQSAFETFYTRCFWHMRRDFKFQICHIPMIIDGLRRNGGREGFLLAAQLSK